jgi:hypothetical protein
VVALSELLPARDISELVFEAVAVRVVHPDGPAACCCRNSMNSSETIRVGVYYSNYQSAQSLHSRCR